MSGVFEGSVQTYFGKKTRRMKWKVTMKQLNKTDSSLQLETETNGKKNKGDFLIHNNKDKTVNIDGYLLSGKKRRPITIKNMKLTENDVKEKFSKLQ